MIWYLIPSPVTGWSLVQRHLCQMFWFLFLDVLPRCVHKLSTWFMTRLQIKHYIKTRWQSTSTLFLRPWRFIIKYQKYIKVLSCSIIFWAFSSYFVCSHLRFVLCVGVNSREPLDQWIKQQRWSNVFVIAKYEHQKRYEVCRWGSSERGFVVRSHL